MAINQNRKGGRGERQACKLLKSLSPVGGLQVEARRSQQYSGTSLDEDSADIITNIPEIRFEVKVGYNDTDIYNKKCKDWVDTAKQETPEDQHWVILRKKDYRDWTIVFQIPGTEVTAETYMVKETLELLIKDKQND